MDIFLDWDEEEEEAEEEDWSEEEEATETAAGTVVGSWVLIQSRAC